MKKTLLRSKLHRINVTQVELDYEGSCAVDVEILAKGNMQEYEKIDIYNVTNGERFSTYLMAAEACLLYTSPSPRDQRGSRMPSSA